MAQTVNVPIQMISCCSTVGDFTPMRFRYEDEEHQIISVSVDEILARKETSFAGNKEIQFTCSAIMKDIKRLFILVYNINTHRWKIFQMLS